MRTVEDIALGHLSIMKRMPARENNRPGRGTNGIGDIAAFESHTLLRDAVEVRGLDQFRSISTDGMRSVIIGKDEKDVGLFGKRPGCRDKKKKDKLLHFFSAKAKLANNRKTQTTLFMDGVYSFRIPWKRSDQSRVENQRFRGRLHR